MKVKYNKLRAFFISLAKRDDGVTAIEYALIAAAIAVAISAVVGALGNSISTTFQTIIGKL